jgi:hypothetical protein
MFSLLKVWSMEKKCSKCQSAFTCQNEIRGCWCEKVQLSTETLAFLEEYYENCLCPECLKKFEEKNHSSPIISSFTNLGNEG